MNEPEHSPRFQQAIEVVYLRAKQWLEFGEYYEEQPVEVALRESVQAALKIETEEP